VTDNVIRIDDARQIVGIETMKLTDVVKETDEDIDPREKKENKYSRPTDRPVSGLTYQLRWPHADTIYMTANFIVDQKGRKIPYEVFFVGGDPETHDMLKVIGRTVTSTFKRGGDVRFVIKDFVKEVSPVVAFVQPMGYAKPFLVKSLAAYIGFTLLDFFHTCDYPGLREFCSERKIFNHVGIGNPNRTDGAVVTVPGGSECPSCHEMAVVRVAGCPTCRNCGESKC
jgi:hypothetical protein